MSKRKYFAPPSEFAGYDINAQKLPAKIREALEAGSHLD